MKRLIYIILVFPLITGFAGLTGPTDLGNEAYRKGEYEEALKQYHEAADGRPGSAEAHYNLGNAYYKLGQYERAKQEYAKAGELDPNMADAYYNAGNSMFRLRDYENALGAYDKAKGEYGKDDKDTEHNIEVVTKLIEKKKQEEQKQQQQQQKSGQKNQNSKSGQQNKPSGSGGQQQPQAGQSPQQAGKQAGPPPMSNEELKALLERQAKEEKGLRNYFRPGEKPDASDRERQIEQMLRGMGMGPMERELRPGEPYVEKDW